MEQFDTDEKLIKNSKDEKKETTINCGQLLLIIICCLVSLCALYYLFKTFKPTTDNKQHHLFDISK